MLPSDISLLKDDNFKNYVKIYADNKKLFFKDFSKA